MKTIPDILAKRLKKLDTERFAIETALRIVNKEPGYLKEIASLKSSIDELMKKNAHLAMENRRFSDWLAQYGKPLLPDPPQFDPHTEDKP